ncbi:hypothetical protein D3C76_1574880 [compost metagenome]
MNKCGFEHFHRLVDGLDGDERCLIEFRKVLNYLVVDLVSMPGSQYGKAMLPLFKACMLRINELDVDIETVGRESLLEVIYQLGELVGLSKENRYLDQWRGDW